SVAAVGNAFAPFTTYYLRVHAELSDGRILVLMAVQVVGSVLGALLLRNFIDGLCARPVFKLFLILQALVFTYWLLLVHGGSGWLDWLPVAYFVVGFGAALNMQGNLKYSPQLSNDAQRALVLAIHSSVVGFLGGLAPILWGWFLKEPGPPARMNIEHFSYYLIASIVMMVVLFPFFGRLKESAPQPLPAFDSSSVLRPFRWVAVSINLVPRGNGHDEDDPKPAAETAEK
ncbi:MAG: MFS transporter, partial [Puniceicoccales bacterium]